MQLFIFCFIRWYV